MTPDEILFAIIGGSAVIIIVAVSAKLAARVWYNEKFEHIKRVIKHTKEGDVNGH